MHATDISRFLQTLLASDLGLPFYLSCRHVPLSSYIVTRVIQTLPMPKLTVLTCFSFTTSKEETRFQSLMSVQSDTAKPPFSPPISAWKSTQQEHAFQDQDGLRPNARPAQHLRRLSRPQSLWATTHPAPSQY